MRRRIILRLLWVLLNSSVRTCFAFSNTLNGVYLAIVRLLLRIVTPVGRRGTIARINTVSLYRDSTAAFDSPVVQTNMRP